MDPPRKHLGVDLLPCSLRYGEESRRAAIKLASAPRPASVRITGWSGGLPSQLAEHMYRTFVPTFTGCDFTVIGGGTRMALRHNPLLYQHGINEVIPLISGSSPRAKTIGVVPRQTKLVYREGVGVIISDKPENPYITIVHPHLDACLLLQYSADKGFEGWDQEWLLSLDYMEALRDEANHQTAHVVFGGGNTTAREVQHVVKLRHNPEKPWWTILVSDAQGVSGKYALDRDFCSTYHNRLRVCRGRDLGAMLQDLGFLNPVA